MSQIINDTKDAIAGRMLRFALRYWGIKNADELDPVVKIIIEALSYELFQFSNDIKNSETRILEKISDLLAPDLLTCPRPAHATLHALPAEPMQKLTPVDHFYTQRKVASKPNGPQDTSLDIYFTPIETVSIFDIKVRYMASGNNLYSYNESFNKLLIANSVNGKQIESYTLWLGVDINSKLDDIGTLPIYFDWQNLDRNMLSRVYELLPLTKWYHNEKEIECDLGLPYGNGSETNSSTGNLFSDHDLLNLLKKNIQNYYSNRYVTISAKRLVGSTATKENYPPIFNSLFTESTLQTLADRLVWLKIIFPPEIQRQVLNELRVHTNVFPVINRYLNNVRTRLRSGRSMIPLSNSFGEQFLAVESVSDELKQYKAVPYREREQEQEAVATFTVREGGMERFDKRNAQELINYLMQLLRSESAAFSAYGQEFVATLLKEINQRIALMEQKVKGSMSNLVEEPHYVIVKPDEGVEFMFVQHWTTMAELANNIRPGTNLQQYNASAVKPGSVFFLTATVGGRNKLKSEERLNAFKYGFMTRNRIVTNEDIRNFCFYELGGQIKNVSIKKGVEISPYPKEGFKRTIDVVLTVLKAEPIESEEWKGMCDHLKSKMQSHSGQSNNYRIILQSET